MILTNDDVELFNAKFQVDENATNVTKILDGIVNSYSESLDELMLAISEDIINVDNPPIQVIERYFLELSNAIYFISSKVERLGIYDGLSKMQFKEKFNTAFINNKIGTDGKNRTATELTAISEEDSKYESVVNDMYNRAYKILKAKVDAANTLCSSLSKVLSHRMQQESAISADDRATARQVLNEGGVVFG